MNLISSRLSDSSYDRNVEELIAMLKNIIAEHERKILELENDLKKWEKKYKEHFFNEDKTNNDHLAKVKLLESQISSFGGQIDRLQEQYEQKEKSQRYMLSGSVLEEGLKLIEQLYCQRNEGRREKQRQRKERQEREGVIEEQQRMIQSLQGQMLELKRQYGESMKRANEYEDKLLSELKKVYSK